MMAERSSMWPFCIGVQEAGLQQNLMKALHFIFQIKLRVQLLLGNLLIKKINNWKMRTDSKHFLSYDDLENCRSKLFTEKGKGNDVETDKGSNWYTSTVNKGGTAIEYKETTLKKIKLKQHLKTEEAQASPQRMDRGRMRTSPNHHTPLQDKNLNIPNKHSFKHKTNLTEFFPISEIEPRNPNHFKTLYSELYPSPKKRSLPYSSIHKESIHIRQASKSEERSLSKSKKKIHFTVFQSKEKEKPKENKSPVKKQQPPTRKINFLVPYRQHASITINLFQSKEKKDDSKSKPKHSNSKESIRSRQKRQRRSRQSSLQKNVGVSKKLIKSTSDYEQDERVKRTLQRLQKYRFVGEYLEVWEIVEKISGFTKSNEPECKWPLLIVDEVFKRIRQDNKFEALVSK